MELNQFANPMRTTLKVGDRVIEFHGIVKGTVTHVERKTDPSKSDKVVVVTDDGATYYNYHTVWSKCN